MATKPVSFRVEAPQANSVTLAGDFNGWDQGSRQLRRRKDGVWWTTMRLAPGTYQYKFIIDGSQWVEDPASPARADNGHGSFNSVCEVV